MIVGTGVFPGHRTVPHTSGISDCPSTAFAKVSTMSRLQCQIYRWMACSPAIAQHPCTSCVHLRCSQHCHVCIAKTIAGGHVPQPSCSAPCKRHSNLSKFNTCEGLNGASLQHQIDHRRACLSAIAQYPTQAPVQGVHVQHLRGPHQCHVCSAKMINGGHVCRPHFNTPHARHPRLSKF